jgi:predicted DNA-binding transcriptional regulator AlpA
MREIETLLGVTDMMRIFGLSRVSIYRNVSLARQCKSRFPLPVSDMKQQLRWSAANVEAYCQSRNNQPQVNVTTVKQKKRQAAIVREEQRLEDEACKRHGIVLQSN